VVSAREIQAVAELLQVSPEGLQRAITFKVTVSQQAPVLTNLPARGCLSLSPPFSVPVCHVGQAWRGLTLNPKGH
jgi:hypothetical protein